MSYQHGEIVGQLARISERLERLEKPRDDVRFSDILGAAFGVMIIAMTLYVVVCLIRMLAEKLLGFLLPEMVEDSVLSYFARLLRNVVFGPVLIGRICIRTGVSINRYIKMKFLVWWRSKRVSDMVSPTVAIRKPDYSITEPLTRKDFIVESLRENSTLVRHTQTFPSNLAFIGEAGDVIGHGLAVKAPRSGPNSLQYWVAPRHVWVNAKQVATSNGRSCDVKLLGKPDEVVTDIVAAVLTPDMREMGVEAVETAGYAEAIARFETSAIVINKDVKYKGYQSTGTVAPSTFFGICQYSGSTEPGCSGGAYYVNGKPVAMHTTGGHHNLGVDFNLIWNRLAIGEAELSATTKYLWGLARRNQKRIRVKEFGLGEYVATVNNKYYTIDAEDIDWDLVTLEDRDDEPIGRVPEARYADQAIEQQLLKPVEDLPEPYQCAAQEIYDHLNTIEVDAVEPAEVLEQISLAAHQRVELARGRIETLKPHPVPSIRNKEEDFQKMQQLQEEAAAWREKHRAAMAVAEEMRQELMAVKKQIAYQNSAQQQHKLSMKLGREDYEKQIDQMQQEIAALRAHSANLVTVSSLAPTVMSRAAAKRKRKLAKRQKALEDQQAMEQALKRLEVLEAENTQLKNSVPSAASLPAKTTCQQPSN